MRDWRGNWEILLNNSRVNQYFHLFNSEMCFPYFCSVITWIGEIIWSRGHGSWKFTIVSPYFLCHFRLSAFAELASDICLFFTVLQLLMKSPQKRLVDMYTLQNSPFFKVINFTNVIEKKVNEVHSHFLVLFKPYFVLRLWLILETDKPYCQKSIL